MKTGSANMNPNYKVLFEGYCTRGGPCGHVLVESNIAALGLKQVVYGGSLYGLTIGTMYKVSISATNNVGIIAAASKHQILAGVPGQPQDLEAAQGVGAMTDIIQWKPPANSGDGTGAGVAIQSNVIEIIVSPTARPVEFNLTLTRFEVVHYVGGRWHTCAAHGEICACTGVARYGQDAMSIPVAVKGQVLCLPGPYFPNLSFGTSFSCDCSVDANILVKGKMMTARVRAANYLGTGVFSLSALVMILGVPAQVGPITVEKNLW